MPKLLRPAKINNNKGRETQRKKSQKSGLWVVRSLKIPFVGMTPMGDYDLASSNVTNTTTTLQLLDPILASTGLMQAFPQHATPIYTHGIFRLRQRIEIFRMEGRFTFVGAVSNALLAADLYNSIRLALYISGKSYSDANNAYLNGAFVGTTVTDVKRVIFDKTVSLPSQAYDTTITTATPEVLNWDVCVDTNWIIDCFSTTATGVGAAWDTEQQDLVMEYTSDSSLTPHPTLAMTFRLFWRYR